MKCNIHHLSMLYAFTKMECNIHHEPPTLVHKNHLSQALKGWDVEEGFWKPRKKKHLELRKKN